MNSPLSGENQIAGNGNVPGTVHLAQRRGLFSCLGFETVHLGVAFDSPHPRRIDDSPSDCVLKTTLSAFQLNTDISVLIDGQRHVLNVLLIELPPLCGRHCNPRISQCGVKHIVDIQMNGVINPAVHL